MSLHTLDENENRLGYYAIPYGPYYMGRNSKNNQIFFRSN